MTKGMICVTGCLAAGLLGPAFAPGQTRVHLPTQARNADFSQYPAGTRPAQVGTMLPVSCAVGQEFFKTDALPGSNTYLCTAPGVWTPVSGDVSDFSQLRECRIVRLSNTVLRVGACQVRVGPKVFSFAGADVTLNGATASDSVYLFFQNGTLVAGYGAGTTQLSGTGIVASPGVAGFPEEALPIGRWTVEASGVWSSSGEDHRAILEADVVRSGLGLVESVNPATGIRSLAIDSAAVVTYQTGTALPPACAQLGHWLVKSNGTAGKRVYVCNGASYEEVGAPVDASYVALAPPGSLTGARTLAAGNGLTLNDGGPGNPVTLATALDLSLLRSVDDFCGRPGPGVFGSGWSATTTGTNATVAGVAAEPNVPCLVRLTSGSAAGDSARLAAGAPGGGSYRLDAGDWTALFRVRFSDVSDLWFAAGFRAPGEECAAPGGSGLLVKFDSAAGDTEFRSLGCNGGVCGSESGLGVTPAAGVWHQIRFTRQTGSVSVQVNTASPGVVTEVPLDAVSPCLWVGTRTEASRSADLDLFAFEMRNLER